MEFAGVKIKLVGIETNSNLIETWFIDLFINQTESSKTNRNLNGF